MQIRWSPEAAEDFQFISERIEIDNPEAATRVARAIYDGCDRLKEFPLVGRTSRAVCRDGANCYSLPCPTSWFIR